MLGFPINRVHTAPDGTRSLQAVVDVPDLGLKVGDIGGRIIDSAFVDSYSWIDAKSEVRSGRVENSIVNGSLLNDSHVFDTRVDNSDLTGCSFSLCTLSSVKLLKWVAFNSAIANVTDKMCTVRDARIFGPQDYVLAHDLGTQKIDACYYRTLNEPKVRAGCWSGPLCEFEQVISGDDWPSGCSEKERARHRPEYRKIIKTMRTAERNWK